MHADFRPLRQPPSRNSCLPTVVRAVLHWHGVQASPDEVSEWCQEESKGCLLDLAIDGLREAGFEVEELTAPTEAEMISLLREAVTSEDDYQPVIVTLQNPALGTTLDHAVVVIHIGQGQDLDISNTVEYMDPLTGEIEKDSTGMFWSYWYYAGQRAFILRP